MYSNEKEVALDFCSNVIPEALMPDEKKVEKNSLRAMRNR